ncbi:MAG: redoxin domain-containing protein [Burkholderiaceae bacterium]
MLRRSFVSLALLCAWALAGSAQARGIVGEPAPAFTATDTAGQTRQLSDFKGKYVVLEWFNPSCPFTRKHYNSGNMQGLHKEFTAKGVVWLSLNANERTNLFYLSPDKLARWTAQQSAAPTATLMDEEGTVGRAYGARVTPHLYIVNPQGTLIYAGGIDSIASSRVEDIPAATNYVRQGLNEALAGKPLTAPVTRPYGCPIKYKSSHDLYPE